MKCVRVWISLAGRLGLDPMCALTLSLRSVAPALWRLTSEGAGVMALGRGCSLPRSNCGRRRSRAVCVLMETPCVSW